MQRLVLILVGLLIVGCTAVAQPTDYANARPNDAVEVDIHAVIDSGSENGGQFTLTFEQPQSSKYDHIAGVIQSSGHFAAYINHLNSQVTLKRDVPIYFKECGEKAAYYDFARKDITMCYELIDRWDKLFDKERKSATAGDAATASATLFILAHETGHAVIDINGIPFTGREEDVADQFATYMLAEMDSYGEQAALDGGEVFLLQGEDEGQLPLWGEHSLDEQRYYNMLCWVYGENPDGHADIAGEELPEKRAKRCAREYMRMHNSWQELLDG